MRTSSSCPACQASALAKTKLHPDETLCNPALIKKYCSSPSEQMAGLNPQCPKDTPGMRNTLTATVAWLFWAVMFWGAAFWFNGGLDSKSTPPQSSLRTPLLRDLEVSEGHVAVDSDGVDKPTAL